MLQASVRAVLVVAAAALPVCVRCAVAGQGAAGEPGGPPHCIPGDRLVEWRPGVEGGIPTCPALERLAPGDLPGDGRADAARAIQQAINRVRTPGAVLLPEGTFAIRSPILMKSGVVLRGMGPDRTHLHFDMPKRGFHGGVQFRGGWAGPEVQVLGGMTSGSRELALASVGALKSGQMAWVSSDNVDEEMYAGHPEWRQDWARRSVGQMVRIVEVRGNGVVLDAPVRLTRAQELRPTLRPVASVRRAGLESLHVKGLDEGEGFLVEIRCAEGCWMRDCELEYCVRAHVTVDHSRFITVESNYIHHAHRYDGGGHGYGVALGFSSSDCLVQNNIFRVLRHAMICSMGTNGNVWAYNFSSEQLDDSDRWRLRDVSVHGHYPYMELFEGNVCEFATSSDWWGAAGPLVTFFRNRFDPSLGEKGGWLPPLQIQYGSRRQNVVGNSFVCGQGVQVQDSCEDAFIEGNLIRGRIEWNRAAVRRLPASLFLRGKPGFWDERPWPATGADVDRTNGARMITLPAQDWYAAIVREKRTVRFSEGCPPSHTAGRGRGKSRSASTRRASAVRAAPRKPKVGALAAHDARLKERIAEVAAAGRVLRFSASSLGGSVSLEGMDPDGTLRVRVTRTGVRVAAGMGLLTLAEKKSLALASLREGRAEDHELAAFYLFALGDRRGAEEQLARAGELGARLEASFE